MGGVGGGLDPQRPGRFALPTQSFGERIPIVVDIVVRLVHRYSDHYFQTCRPFFRPHYSKSRKAKTISSEHSDHFCMNCVSLMTLVLFLTQFTIFCFDFQEVPFTRITRHLATVSNGPRLWFPSPLRNGRELPLSMAKWKNSNWLTSRESTSYSSSTHWTSRLSVQLKSWHSMTVWPNSEPSMQR